MRAADPVRITAGRSRRGSWCGRRRRSGRAGVGFPVVSADRRDVARVGKLGAIELAVGVGHDAARRILPAADPVRITAGRSRGWWRDRNGADRKRL